MDEKRSILIFVRPELVETNHYIAFSKDNTSFCTPEVFTPVDQKESELKMGDLSWLRK